MRVAVLTNTAASYFRPMADGLARMLRRIGVDSAVFDYGQPMLYQPSMRWREPGESVKSVVKEIAISGYVRRLRSFDAVVVVQAAPWAFANDAVSDPPWPLLDCGDPLALPSMRAVLPGDTGKLRFSDL